MPELVQQFIRSKRSLLENAFTEFVRLFFSYYFLYHISFHKTVQSY